MWPDYSCCDLCPYGPSDEALDVCNDCEARAAEKRLNRLFAGLEPDPYDSWEEGDLDG